MCNWREWVEERQTQPGMNKKRRKLKKLPDSVPWVSVVPAVVPDPCAQRPHRPPSEGRRIGVGTVRLPRFSLIPDIASLIILPF